MRVAPSDTAREIKEKADHGWNNNKNKKAAEVKEKGASYPVQLSLECESHCFFPD